MTLKAQVLICIVLIIALIAIVNMVRKRSLELKYVLVWVCSRYYSVYFYAVSIHNGTCCSIFLEFISPVNMIFFMGFVLSLVIIFTLTVALSRVTARVRKLAQMIALQDEEKREK